MYEWSRDVTEKNKTTLQDGSAILTKFFINPQLSRLKKCEMFIFPVPVEALVLLVKLFVGGWWSVVTNALESVVTVPRKVAVILSYVKSLVISGKKEKVCLQNQTQSALKMNSPTPYFHEYMLPGYRWLGHTDIY